ncbi:NB-LRR type disease resistance protein Rps1-k-2 [Dorcoceras hygrometricum]|uniref:NB-LRR type disease resistance protein Rps1-k-2 n=1 Tax=Dorcoceras hygrometricum TaxID=472368 RepID=A0A2Z7CM49_9LAMI|nr:NB-LRR type disease resistance protein Rps1-k-2 [Dorcoceras hygrometricum]
MENDLQVHEISGTAWTGLVRDFGVDRWRRRDVVWQHQLRRWLLELTSMICRFRELMSARELLRKCDLSTWNDLLDSRADISVNWENKYKCLPTLSQFLDPIFLIFFQRAFDTHCLSYPISFDCRPPPFGARLVALDSSLQDLYFGTTLEPLVDLYSGRDVVGVFEHFCDFQPIVLLFYLSSWLHVGSSCPVEFAGSWESSRLARAVGVVFLFSCDLLR